MELQLKYWCYSAYQAKNYYRENYNYVIAKDEFDSKRIEYIKNIGLVPKSEYKLLQLILQILELLIYI